MRGIFRMRVYRSGKLVETYEDDNLIVDGARAAVAALIAGEGAEKHIAKIAFGTNGSVPTPDDTELESAFVKPLSGVSYPKTGHAKFTWQLLANEANGLKIIEFGLLCKDGTLWARKVREEAIPKASDIAIVGEWIITH